MAAVLGIDAAWSAANPSGVALIRQQPDGGWNCVSVAPSYDSFLQLANGNAVNWNAVPACGLPQPQQLLRAAGALLQDEGVTVVAVDIPVSNHRLSDAEFVTMISPAHSGDRNAGPIPRTRTIQANYLQISWQI